MYGRKEGGYDLTGFVRGWLPNADSFMTFFRNLANKGTNKQTNKHNQKQHLAGYRCDKVSILTIICVWKLELTL